ncbi:MAG: ATP-dependent DNA helicase [Gammaproteobacteria bacterium]|nr:ATP-dependent DNA helicase [Gammaproteobacteria bacterium]
MSFLDFTDRAAEILGPEGPFADVLPGFTVREQQRELADAIEVALANDRVLIGEAGTGVGKTFAYLVPAMLSGLRVIVSTGTRHLQDQLFSKDIPRVREILGVDVLPAILKGRANYLCKHRLAQARGNALLIQDPETLRQLEVIHKWSLQTRSGDVAEVKEVPEDAPVWAHVTSTPDFCSAHEHHELEDCFVHHARRAAQEADIVVINHHLFFADLALKDEGYGEVLPSANAFILDEAHQIPEVASQFFSQRFSSRQLEELVRDAQSAQLAEAPDMAEIREAARQLEQASRDMRLAMGRSVRREPWSSIEHSAPVQKGLGALDKAYKSLLVLLEVASVRGKSLESCLRRCEAQIGLLSLFSLEVDQEKVYWFETYRTQFSLYVTPLTVADSFQRSMSAHKAAWVFTSATLSVDGSFAHFRESLGLENQNVDECRLDSPFDYTNNALIYLPPRLPDPRDPHYTVEVLEAALPVMNAAEGRSFLLFTSYRAMNEAADWLVDRCAFPLLVQGDMPKQELMTEFVTLGNAVLLGTASFWEGVDVRGEALSCVVIDKLPFASPGDPVIQARIEALRKRGGNPFMDYQLPQAAIMLKQGVGRLIRDMQDRGVLMLCDPRLRTKSYGRIFFRSLPPMRQTVEQRDVEQFFSQGKHA